MAFSRYQRVSLLDSGRQYGTSRAHEVIREAIASGELAFQELTLYESQRLDHIAGLYYGNGRFYWVIAAASNIGWALQVPPGTRIVIPDLEGVRRLVG